MKKLLKRQKITERKKKYKSTIHSSKSLDTNSKLWIEKKYKAGKILLGSIWLRNSFYVISVLKLLQKFNGKILPAKNEHQEFATVKYYLVSCFSSYQNNMIF